MKSAILIFVFISIGFWGCTTDKDDNKEAITEEQSSVPALKNEEEDIPFALDSAIFSLDSDTAYTRVREIVRNSEEQIDTQFDYPSFSIIFHGYGFQDTRPEYFIRELSSSADTPQFSVVNDDGELSFSVKADTLRLVEDVFNDLSSVLIEIIPKNKDDRFNISYSLKEGLEEHLDKKIYDYQNFKSNEEYLDAIKKWKKNRVHWESWTDHKYVSDSLNYYFKMPVIDLSVYEDAIKQRKGLRDTLVDFSGESDDIATVVYKNKPCYYGIERGILAIERLVAGKTKERRIISIIFTSGC